MDVPDEVNKRAMEVCHALATLEMAKQTQELEVIAVARDRYERCEARLVESIARWKPGHKMLLIGEEEQIKVFSPDGTLVLSDPGTIDDIPF